MDTPMFEESKNVDSGDPIGTLVQNKRFNSVWRVDVQRFSELFNRADRPF